MFNAALPVRITVSCCIFFKKIHFFWIQNRVLITKEKKNPNSPLREKIIIYSTQTPRDRKVQRVGARMRKVPRQTSY